jgi:predicted nucleotidyltransferase
MSVGILGKTLNKSWPAIEKAKAAADAQINKLRAIIQESKIDSEDISIVVFGSLARREWTSGSDLDWTMLIDGEADHEHAHTAHKFSELLEKAEFRSPGATRTFGTLTFSHNVIHQIGGLDDTNRNTTQRLLLLLESIPGNRREAYDRVIRAVLRRYLQNDFREFRLKVPRFLLNDVHRYWRTLCVDYANKCWTSHVLQLRFRLDQRKGKSSGSCPICRGACGVLDEPRSSDST